ncbi:MAG: flagellar assembly peptidoglycan hydrolase FlgJ [Hydrogenophaga sp.]|nr:flagellar assembly peptidoglycan hydrolase FlgJ [Hydrogenophaga sp.]
MSTVPTSTQGLAVDPGALNALKYGAGMDGQGGKTALKEAAKQFESLFMRELIKSMRDATQKSGLLEGQGSDLGTDLLDQQLAVKLSGLPGGLSESIERQLSRQMNPKGADAAVSAAPSGESQPFKPLKRSALNALLQYAPPDRSTAAARASEGVAATAGKKLSPTQRQAAFVSRHNDAAAAVARESGIPAGYMIGQAGHETGWGRSEIKMKDGTSSFNLFGIKATPSWKGKVAEVTTTEYVNGVPRKTTARFRAYSSYEESFRDYARLITRSPRYDRVMHQVGSVHGFASGLQRAGYATDPNYAAKLSRAINATLNLQRLQS